MGSKTTQQSSSTSSTTPAALSQLQDIYSRVAGAASTPYTPYTGELTAGINGQQNLGISNLNNAASSAQPYYGQAANYATQAGAPISASAIQGYENPYTQSVINSTQAQFNEQNGQQQQSLLGNAAAQGALGGDRSAVAQAALAGQQQTAQAPVIAGLQSQNYQQALAAAQADRSAAGNAAGLYGNLGTAAQNSALTGAQAQIGAGTLQQGTQQASDTANYQQYLQAQGFPYQQAQFYASLGLPVASAMGSSSNGTTSTQTNPWAQIAGLGIAGAGLFMQDGGSVPHMADGGGSGGYISSDAGYIPTVQMGHITPLQSTPAPSAASSSSAANPFASATQGLNGMRGVFASPDEMGSPGVSSPLSVIGAAGDYAVPTFMKDGGFADTVHNISRAIKRARGGTVDAVQGQNGVYSVPGYDDGGPISFDDRFNGLVGRDPVPSPFTAPAQDDQGPIIPDPGLQRVSPEAVQAWRDGVDHPNPALMADVGGPPSSPLSMPQTAASAPNASAPAPSSPMQVALPKQITNPDDDASVPDNAMAFGPGANRSPYAINTQTAAIPDSSQPPEQHFGKSLFGVNLSDKTRQAIVAAGLGMAASRNPNFLGALGEGGLSGLAAYGAANKDEREAADKAISQKQNQQRIDQEAQRIAQSAEQFSKNFGLSKRRVDLEEDKTPAGYRATKDGSYEPIPGGPADPATVEKLTKAKRPGAEMDDDTADFLAERVLAGDTRALVGLGRGAQGADNIAKIQRLVAGKARSQGIDPTDMLAKVAEQSGAAAAQRTFGTNTARMAVNATEAQGAIELGRTASAAVPRTNWVPVNKAVQAYQAGTSDPALAKFGAANLAIINTYARAISPSGVPTVNDKQHAEHLLSTATGPDAYNAILDQMNEEIKIAHGAPAKAKKELEDIRKGRTPAAAASQAAATPARVKQNNHTYERQPDGSYKAVD